MFLAGAASTWHHSAQSSRIHRTDGLHRAPMNSRVLQGQYRFPATRTVSGGQWTFRQGEPELYLPDHRVSPRGCILTLLQSAISNVRGTRKTNIQCTEDHQKQCPNVQLFSFIAPCARRHCISTRNPFFFTNSRIFFHKLMNSFYEFKNRLHRSMSQMAQQVLGIVPL